MHHLARRDNGEDGMSGYPVEQEGHDGSTRGRKKKRKKIGLYADGRFPFSMTKIV